MTLTFNPVTWFLFATHCLIMMIICAIFFSNPTMHIYGSDMNRFHWPMHKVYVLTVTLNSGLVMWLLFATHRLVIMIICARLFSNPTMHNKGMGRTRTGFTEVYAQSLSADCATWFLFATHRLVMIINCAKLFSNPIMYS